MHPEVFCVGFFAEIIKNFVCLYMAPECLLSVLEKALSSSEISCLNLSDFVFKIWFVNLHSDNFLNEALNMLRRIFALKVGLNYWKILGKQKQIFSIELKSSTHKWKRFEATYIKI